MASFLILCLAIECILILGWGLLRRERLLQFPVLAAAVFAGWVFPQFVGLRNHEGIPPGALEKALVMTILCFGGCYFGYRQNAKPARIISWKLSRKKLIVASAVLSLLGAYFFFKVGQLAAEATMMYGGGWTGVITIYVFLASMLTTGFAIALVLHLKKPSLETLAILAFDTLFYFQRIFISGRRAAMIELFLMVLFALWFNKRWLPSRIIVIGSFVAGALIVNSIGDYRGVMLNEYGAAWSGAGIKEILSINYVDNISGILRGDFGGEEVLNAVMGIEATEKYGGYDFGLTLWNNFIVKYVPAQLVGKELKDLLVFDVGEPSFLRLGHVQHTGSTFTGIYDSFLSFWYFGSIKYFFIGLIFSRWYRAATSTNIAAQLVVMLTAAQALQAITHSTHHYFLSFIDLIIFLLPVLYFAKKRKDQSMADSSTRCNKDESGDGWLRMSRHHGRLNR